MSNDRATSFAPTTDGTLRVEARYLHWRLFSRDPSWDLINAYVRAHAEIPGLSAIDPQQLRTLALIVSRRLDAAGIEPWLRNGSCRHALSIKLSMLTYLAECSAGHPEFNRRSARRARAPLKMGLVVTSAVFALLRGRMQIAWHGLV